MTDNLLDEIFKKQLPGHESPVPEDMWERISRKKDRDRKGFFFFFTLAGLFLLGFGIAAFLLFGNNRNKRNEDSAKTQKVIFNSDTVQSEGTNHNIQGNHSGNHLATLGNADTVMNASELNDAGSRKSYNPKQRKIIQLSIAKETSNSVSRQADPKNDSDKLLSEKENTVDTVKKSSDKAIPVLSSTPKPVPADSVKTAASKKSDSTKKNIASKWSLDLYASPDYPIDHKPQEYIKGRLSYSIGLRLNRSFGKHFSGKIGIQFSQLNFILPDSSSSWGAHHLIRWDLPLLAGYSWGNETLGMTINAGVIVNLYSSLHPDPISYMKSNTGLSLYIGFSFSKHINERMDIFSEPYYRYQLSSMVTNPNYFPKYIDVVGISFGVRYHFKK